VPIKRVPVPIGKTYDDKNWPPRLAAEKRFERSVTPVADSGGLHEVTVGTLSRPSEIALLGLSQLDRPQAYATRQCKATSSPLAYA